MWINTLFGNIFQEKWFTRSTLFGKYMWDICLEELQKWKSIHENLSLRLNNDLNIVLRPTGIYFIHITCSLCEWDIHKMPFDLSSCEDLYFDCAQ